MRYVLAAITIVSAALSAGEKQKSIYEYAPYNEGKLDPQVSGWPLTPEERSYVVEKAEHDRRPGRESNKHLPHLWPQVPSAGFFGGDAWLKLHEAHVNTARANQGPIDVLLVGDSITIQWGDSWKKHFPELKAVNIGIGGDKTQNVLWRLDHGGVDGLQPKAIVLMIGNNNMFFAPETGVESVALGIQMCVKNLRAKFPTALIILAKILPAHAPGIPFYEDIKKTNAALDPLKLDSDPILRVLDLWSEFTNADGTIKKDLFTPDNIHLSPAGYAVYASRLKPFFDEVFHGKSMSQPPKKSTTSVAPETTRFATSGTGELKMGKDIVSKSNEICIDATNFDKSFGAIAVKSDEGFAASGPSFIMNGGAEYTIQVPITSKYTLSALIAGSDKRPVDVFIDDMFVLTGFDNKTGDWLTISAQWFEQGVISLLAGTHRIAFKPKGPMPHFCAFKLTAAQDFPRAPFPAATLERGSVEPAWATLMKELKQRRGWRPHRTAHAYAEAPRVLVGPGTADEQRALITLLAVGQSPFAIGVPLIEPNALANPVLKDLHQRGADGRMLPVSATASQAGVTAWTTSIDTRNENMGSLDLRRDCYVAVFGTGNASVSAEFALADMGLSGPCSVHDCWTGANLPLAEGVVIVPVKPKNAGLYRISALGPANNHLKARGDLLAASEKFLYKKTPQEDLYAYLLRPVGGKQQPRPAILYFSGGGWSANNVTWVIQECAWFRDHGIIAIACDYRVTGRHGTDIPAAVADAKSAVRYVRAHAKELGVDPERIIVAGGSAGGHIAACTAMPGHDELGEDQSVSSRANALVLGNPVVGKGFNEGFFVQHPTMSPLELAKSKGWPPTILINGTADTITPQVGAELFTQRMKEAGNICELISIVGGGHGATWPTSSPHFEPAFTRVVAFLKEHGFVPRIQ